MSARGRGGGRGGGRVPTSGGRSSSRSSSRIVPTVPARLFSEAIVVIESAVPCICGWLGAAFDGVTHYEGVSIYNLQGLEVPYSRHTGCTSLCSSPLALDSHEKSDQLRKDSVFTLP